MNAGEVIEHRFPRPPRCGVCGRSDQRRTSHGRSGLVAYWRCACGCVVKTAAAVAEIRLPDGSTCFRLTDR